MPKPKIIPGAPMLVTPKTWAATQHLLTHNGQPVALFTNAMMAQQVSISLNYIERERTLVGDFALGTPPANQPRKEVKRVRN